MTRAAKQPLLTEADLSHILSEDEFNAVGRAMKLAEDLKLLRIGVQPQVWAIYEQKTRQAAVFKAQGLRYWEGNVALTWVCHSDSSGNDYAIDDRGCNCAASVECKHIRGIRAITYRGRGE